LELRCFSLGLGDQIGGFASRILVRSSHRFSLAGGGVRHRDQSILGKYPDAPDLRAPARKIKRLRGQQTAHHTRRIVDHWNNTSIVEPGGANHAYHTDDAPLTIAIRRNNGGGT